MPSSSHVRRAQRPAPEILLPGNDTTWEDYCHHGEPYLSGVASLVIHTVVILMLVSGIAALFSESSVPVADIPPIFVVGDGKDGSGQGRVDGGVTAPGSPGPGKEDQRSLPLDQRTKLNAPEAKPDAGVSRDGAIGELSDIGEALRRKARQLEPVVKQIERNQNDLARRNGPGLMGKGSDGGWGGVGTLGGVGNALGTGVPMSPRDKRMERWEIVFSTTDARNYLQQLDAIGAIVAVSDRAGNVQTIVNLKDRPARLETRDVLGMKRIFWIDDRRESVDSVAAELGLDFSPNAIVAFFPHEFEQQLVAKEKAHAGRREEDIARTRFAISFRRGSPVVRVVEPQSSNP